MASRPVQRDSANLLSEIWRFERRSDGVYVVIEEIGGQGDLGPFIDHASAQSALLAYLRGELDEPSLHVPRENGA